ncbi:MAG: hypothetical protein JW929_12935 [Anaerolineales bacterium]|nr:hypothetical protein [Anaerolineales bacterium]
MNQKVSTMIGTILILLGGLFLLVNAAFQAAGFWIWRTWPLFIVGGGAMFMLVPLFYRAQTWTGVFFIPGTLILAAGLLLLFSSIGRQWDIWSWGWSLIVVALAAGLVLAARTTRILWMGVPAILLGATGLILLYCAVTGNWSDWVWLWGFEVAAVGGMILAIGCLAKNLIVRTVGWAFVGFGAFAATAMMALTGRNSQTMYFLSAAVLIVGGIALIAGGLLSGKKRLPNPAPSAPTSKNFYSGHQGAPAGIVSGRRSFCCHGSA